MNCKECHTAVPAHVDRCVSCGADAGFPNVRAAGIDAEVAALNERYDQERRAADARGCGLVAARLEAAVADSRAVLARSWGVISRLLSSDTEIYSTYHQQIKEEARLPENNEYDVERESIDAKIFPYYYEKIRFAALSLDGSGPAGYGGGSMVFRTSHIENRTTVFEQNTLTFYTTRRIAAGQRRPLGYVATWGERAKLAVAKLGPRLQETMQDADLAGLVLMSTGNPATDDYLESHIYGPLHRSAIEYARGKMPTNDLDRAIVGALKERLHSEGIRLDLQ